MAVKVLVVDDEKLIVKGLKFSLEQDDMEVECAYDGEEALEYAKNNQYDIILLDIMLPKLDGMQVCQQIREFSNIPIIMLTAKGEEMDELQGFECGADEYIAKPFSPKILTARVDAIIRRAYGVDSNEIIEIGGITIDKAAHIVKIDGEEIELSYKEFELLTYFIENKGIVLDEASVVAFDVDTYDIVGVGNEAYKMIGKTPAGIRAMHPIDDGVISRSELVEDMVSILIKEVSPSKVTMPRVVASIPSEVTEVEKRAVVNAVSSIGVRKVYLIEAPKAAAMGCSLDITSPHGILLSLIHI